MTDACRHGREAGSVRCSSCVLPTLAASSAQAVAVTAVWPRQFSGAGRRSRSCGLLLRGKIRGCFDGPRVIIAALHFWLRKCLSANGRIFYFVVIRPPFPVVF